MTVQMMQSMHHLEIRTNLLFNEIILLNEYIY